MEDRRSEINEFMEKLDYVSEARSCVLGIEARLLRDNDYGDSFMREVNEYMDNPENIRARLETLKQMAAEHGENEYSLDLVFVIHCFIILHGRYRAAGISEEIFWATADDTRCKLNECIEYKNIAGIFVAWWYDWWFSMKRFALGRFQYEYGPVYNGPDIQLPCGYTVKTGTPYVNFHIPSSGVPLTDDVRLDSYRRAEEFYRDKFGNGPVLLGVSTWLYYEKHRQFLPEGSNILRFMSDAFIYRSDDGKGFSCAWRVFGKYSVLPPEEWPENTGLRRAYKNWVLAGGTGGEGRGFILMDGGKNVTHIPGYFDK
ncbi:MAG: acyltransferase domain-containing protein [Clostridia bacterium]|nr:acyltransferase domain-containing protein [Clostridia bacterium]